MPPKRSQKTPPAVLVGTYRKKDVKIVLQDRFGLTAVIQVVPVPNEKRTIVLLENVPVGPRMSIAGLERLARRIAKELGGELEGTVNLDFVSLGHHVTFEMMVEFAH